MSQLIRVFFMAVFLAFASSEAYAMDKIDLNTATATQLQDVKGIGPKLAKSIVKYRTEHKGFNTLEELKSVRGVGPKNFARFKADLTLGSKKSRPKK